MLRLRLQACKLMAIPKCFLLEGLEVPLAMNLDESWSVRVLLLLGKSLDVAVSINSRC